jgi:hypothetical protein
MGANSPDCFPPTGFILPFHGIAAKMAHKVEAAAAESALMKLPSPALGPAKKK